MISLANMVWRERKNAYLVIGVSDNGQVIDTSKSLCADATYQQIISAYVEPPIDFLLNTRVIQDNQIGVFIIRWSDFPHVTKKRIHDDKGILELDSDMSWIRRGSQKVELTKQELVKFTVSSIKKQDIIDIKDYAVFPGAQQSIREDQDVPTTTKMDSLIPAPDSDFDYRWFVPSNAVTEADIDYISEQYSEFNDEFRGNIKRELRKESSRLCTFLKNLKIDPKHLLNQEELVGEDQKIKRGLYKILPNLLLISHLVLPKLGGISISQLSRILGLSRSQITKRINSIPSQAIGHHGLFYRRENPDTKAHIFSITPIAFEKTHKLLPADLQDPLEHFKSRFGGTFIETEEELRNTLNIDYQRSKTLVREDMAINLIIEKISERNKPIIITGEMGTGKTIRLFHLGQSLLKTNKKIIINPSILNEELNDELEKINGIILIDDFNQYVISKEINVTHIPRKMKLVATSRLLNWQRLCRDEATLLNKFEIISLIQRDLKNTEDFEFLHNILNRNLREYNIETPSDPQERKELIESLMQKSEGLVLYISEVISDINRLSQRTDEKRILTSEYLETLPSGLLNLSAYLLHRDFIRPIDSDYKIAFQIELTVLVLLSRLNPPDTLTVFHREIIQKITQNLKKNRSSTIDLAFQTPFPTDFLTYVGCDLYRFSHSFWISIFQEPDEIFHPVLHLKDPSIEVVVETLNNINNEFDDEKFMEVVNNSVESAINDNKEKLTRSLVINALNLNPIYHFPNWIGFLQEDQFIYWLDHEIDATDPICQSNIPYNASQDELWNLLFDIMRIYVEQNMLDEADYYINMFKKTDRYLKDPKTRVRVLNREGSTLSKRFKTKKAEKVFSRSLKIAEENGLLKDMSTAYGGLGDAAKYSGDNHLAKEYYNKSFMINNLYSDEFSYDSIVNLIRLAEIAFEEREYSHLEENLALILSWGLEDKDFFVVTKAFLFLGDLEKVRGNEEGARAFYQQALELGEKNYITDAVLEATFNLQLLDGKQPNEVIETLFGDDEILKYRSLVKEASMTEEINDLLSKITLELKILTKNRDANIFPIALCKIAQLRLSIREGSQSEIENYLDSLEELFFEVIEKNIDKKILPLKHVTVELAQYYSTFFRFEKANYWLALALKYVSSLSLFNEEVLFIKLLMAAVKGELGEIINAIEITEATLSQLKDDSSTLKSRGLLLITYLYKKKGELRKSEKYYSTLINDLKKSGYEDANHFSYEKVTSWGPQPVLSLYLESLNLSHELFFKKIDKFRKETSSESETDRYKEFRVTNSLAEKLIWEKKYKEARKMLLTNLKQLMKESQSEKDEFEWGNVFLICLYRIGKTYQEEGYSIPKLVQYHKRKQKFFTKAARYFVKGANWIAAKEKRRKHFFDLRMEFLLSLGFCCRDIKEYEKGKRALNAVIKTTEKSKDPTSRKNNTRAKGIKGLIFFEEHEYKEAINLFVKALKQAEEIEYLEYIGLMNRHLGYCYRHLNEMKKAETHFTKAAGIFKLMGKEQHFQHMEFERYVTSEIDKDKEE